MLKVRSLENQQFTNYHCVIVWRVRKRWPRPTTLFNTYSILSMTFLVHIDVFETHVCVFLIFTTLWSNIPLVSKGFILVWKQEVSHSNTFWELYLPCWIRKFPRFFREKLSNYSPTNYPWLGILYPNTDS